MVKGDTMSFGFQLQGLDGSTPTSIKFTCKDNPESDEVIFVSSLTEEDGSDGIWLDSEDTENDVLTYGVRDRKSVV